MGFCVSRPCASNFFVSLSHFALKARSKSGHGSPYLSSSTSRIIGKNDPINDQKLCHFGPFVQEMTKGVWVIPDRSFFVLGHSGPFLSRREGLGQIDSQFLDELSSNIQQCSWNCEFIIPTKMNSSPSYVRINYCLVIHQCYSTSIHFRQGHPCSNPVRFSGLATRVNVCACLTRRLL